MFNTMADAEKNIILSCLIDKEFHSSRVEANLSRMQLYLRQLLNSESKSLNVHFELITRMQKHKLIIFETRCVFEKNNDC